MDGKRIGIIGLGHIGLAIAKRLVTAGISPLGYRRGDPTAFVALGGISAPDIETLVTKSDTVFLVLPDIQASSKVIAGILEAASSPLTLVDVTSQPPANALANAARAARKGHLYVEAPVSGTPAAVETGAGQFLVGSNVAGFAQIEPLLAGIAARVLHLGDVGAASALKSAALLIMSINILGMAEGLAYATSFGVDPGKAVEALMDGPAGSAAMRHRGLWMASEEFAAKLGRMADFEALLQAIRASATTRTDLFQQVLGYLGEGVEAGIGDQDIAGLYALIRKAEAKAM